MMEGKRVQWEYGEEQRDLRCVRELSGRKSTWEESKMKMVKVEMRERQIF
jgi:hypothetical protein